MHLNDLGDKENEPEPISDGRQAMARLAGWPTLGSIEYAMPEGMATVSFEGPESKQAVQAITISILPRAFEKGGDESRKRYQAIAQELHRRLKARRTIMGWGLTAYGLRWVEEVARLERGEHSGTYSILDLRDGEDERAAS